MSAFEKIRDYRTEERRRVAQECAQRVLDHAESRDITIELIGSLARGGFLMHSDVDFFVHDDVSPSRRLVVERLVASAFKGSRIPYDVIYASDLTRERAQEFMNG